MRWRSALSLATFVAFFAMIAVFVGYIASLGIRVSPPANRTALSLDVADINNIAVDSNVLLRGVPVGKVTSIDTAGDTKSRLIVTCGSRTSLHSANPT
jgi:phospholipid/cholesterol/gamma-HCH transport system substrate-binding protein